MNIRSVLTVVIALQCLVAPLFAQQPNIIFVMADDMGWAQTGYYKNPVLKTPNLDAMAAAGLRFDRFYAGAPNCSPTRSTVLTGRSNDRTGVLNHGYALRLQEKTIAAALKKAGYVTAHFGKWHLNGFSGPGAPVLKEDPRGPGAFGFDEWVSVTNFYDVDPLMSRMGKIEQMKGDSSEVAMNEAIAFLKNHKDDNKPMFALVWFGSPHSPFKSLPGDAAAFENLKGQSVNHHGELAAMDRSIGTLRKALREMNIADNTLLVFNSDNGGLPGITPSPVGDLRGFKNTVYEGGLRVPAIMEWPAVIKQPRITMYPAGTVDLFPTVADIVGLPEDALLKPVDGVSLKPLFTADQSRREKPLMFRHQGRAAMLDYPYKLITQNHKADRYELYDLEADPDESDDLSAKQPERLAKMKDQLQAWSQSVQNSFEGKDYPEGKVTPADLATMPWYKSKAYEPYLEQWKDRWEFRSYLDARDKNKNKSD